MYPSIKASGVTTVAKRIPRHNRIISARIPAFNNTYVKVGDWFGESNLLVIGVMVAQETLDLLV